MDDLIPELVIHRSRINCETVDLNGKSCTFDLMVLLLFDSSYSFPSGICFNDYVNSYLISVAKLTFLKLSVRS